MLIVQSSSNEVYRNLAIEEYLMEHATEHGPVLFLWQSECAVVVGRNQNPWRECRLDRMRAEGISLARRISGGGTVYHDVGNLNYCVIVDRAEYREGQAYEMVFKALESLGIRAERTGKSNLSVDGLKFSGNAFSFRKDMALHHGTLLLNSNLERLHRYLGSMFADIETHAIPSVPADVGNLSCEVEEVSSALMESFQVLYGSGRSVLWSESNLDATGVRLLEEKQRSKEWKYGETPRFSVGVKDCRIEVEKGVVKSVFGERKDIWAGQSFAELDLLLIT